VIECSQVSDVREGVLPRVSKLFVILMQLIVFVTSVEDGLNDKFVICGLSYWLSTSHQLIYTALTFSSVYVRLDCCCCASVGAVFESKCFTR